MAFSLSKPTPEEARAQHENHTVKGAVSSGANPALDYEQRPAEDTNYASRIVDLSRYLEEEGDQA